MGSFVRPRTNTFPGSLSCTSLCLICPQVHRSLCFCVLSRSWRCVCRWPFIDDKFFFKLPVRVSTLAQQQNVIILARSSPSLLCPSTRITLWQRQKRLQGIVKVCSDIAAIPLAMMTCTEVGWAPEEQPDQSWQSWVVPCGLNPCCCCQSSDTICHHVELKGLKV